MLARLLLSSPDPVQTGALSDAAWRSFRKSLKKMLPHQTDLAKTSAPLIKAQRKSDVMNRPASNPEFDLRHPVLSRLGNWPVVCAAISAIFLSTVYVLGNFGHKSIGNRSPLTDNRVPSAIHASIAR
jgi:hypothetical protein